MPKTIELDIAKFWEFPATVTIKKLNFGELVDLKDNMPMYVDPFTQLPKEKEGAAALMFVQAALIQAPFIKGKRATIEEIRELDYELGNFIAEKVLELNGLSPN